MGEIISLGISIIIIKLQYIITLFVCIRSQVKISHYAFLYVPPASQSPSRTTKSVVQWSM